MLTPRSDDPKRESELKRRKAHPETFGPGTIITNVGAKKDAKGMNDAERRTANAVADRLEAIKKASKNLKAAKDLYDTAKSAADTGIKTKASKQEQDAFNVDLDAAEEVLDAAQDQLDSLMDD